MLVIGVVGEKGAGKGTFTKLLLPHLQNFQVEVVRTSDVLYDTLKIWGIEATRSNLQNMAIVMDKQFGVGSLSRAVEARIHSSEAEVVILEGIRWKSDIGMLRSFECNLLVYVTAEAKKRWERTRLRGEKADESEASWGQFEREEKAGTEVDIASIGSEADIKVENNGSLDDFEREINRIWQEKVSQMLDKSSSWLQNSNN